NQMNGPHVSLLELVTLTPFTQTKDYESYLSRLHQVPRMFDQVMSNMRQGMQAKLMPPRFLLEKVFPQAQDIASKTGVAGPCAKPVEKFPEGVPEADQQRLRAAVLAAVDTEVVPAYQKFANFVRDDYAPHGRSEPGIWALPDGGRRYRFHIREMTTT